MKEIRRILGVLLCMTILFTVIVNPAVTRAADETSTYCTMETIAECREKGTAPIISGMENKVFAGWYKTYENNEYKNPLKSGETVEGAYAKFADAKALTVKCQFTLDTKADSENTNLRLLTSVDSLNYKSVGFDITVDGVTQNVASEKVYKTIYGYTSDGVNAYTPAGAFENNDSLYFMAFTLLEIPNSVFGTTIKVTPKWITLDGITVTGQSRDVVISELIAAQSKVETDIPTAAQAIAGYTWDWTDKTMNMEDNQGEIVDRPEELANVDGFGSKVLKVTMENAGTGLNFTGTNGIFEAGKTYKISTKIYAPASSGGFNIYWNLASTTTTGLTRFDDSMTGKGTAYNLEVVFTAQEGDTIMGWYPANLAGTAEIYVGDFTIAETIKTDIPTAGQIRAGYTWNWSDTTMNMEGNQGEIVGKPEELANVEGFGSKVLKVTMENAGTGLNFTGTNGIFEAGKTYKISTKIYAPANSGGFNIYWNLASTTTTGLTRFDDSMTGKGTAYNLEVVFTAQEGDTIMGWYPANLAGTAEIYVGDFTIIKKVETDIPTAAQVAAGYAWDWFYNTMNMEDNQGEIVDKPEELADADGFGSKVLKVTMENAETGLNFTGTNGIFESGKTYKISTKIYVPASSGGFNIYWNLASTTTTGLTRFDDSMTGKGTAYNLEVVFTAQEGDTIMGWYPANLAGTAVIYVGDFTIIEKAETDIPTPEQILVGYTWNWSDTTMKMKDNQGEIIDKPAELVNVDGFGSKVLKVTIENAGTGLNFTGTNGIFEAGKTYKISTKIYAPANSGGFNIYWNLASTTTTGLTRFDDSMTGKGIAYNLEVVFTAQEGDTIMGWYPAALNGTAVIYVGDFTIIETVTVLPSTFISLAKDEYTDAFLSDSSFGLSAPAQVGVDKTKYETEVLYPVLTDSEFDEDAVFQIQTGAGASGIEEAVANAKAMNAQGKKVKIKFPAGEYPVNASEVTTGAALNIDGFDGIYIEGENTVITIDAEFTKWIPGVNIVNSNDVHIQGLAIDYINSNVFAGTVISVNNTEHTITVEADAEYAELLSKITSVDIAAYLEIDKNTLAPRENGNWTQPGDASRQPEGMTVSGRNVTIQFCSALELTEAPSGTRAVVYIYTYKSHGVLMENSANLYFEDFAVYTAPGMAMVPKKIENLYMNNFRICNKPGTERYYTSTSDGLHYINVRGDVKITNSLFEYSFDDAINFVTGFYMTVSAIASSDDVITIDRYSVENTLPKEGDIIEFYDNSLNRKAIVTVVEASQSGNMYICKVMGDYSVVTAGMYCANVSASAKVEFTNNIIRNKRNRGMLIQVRDATIENNTFMNIAHGTFNIHSEIVMNYFEGIMPQNISIKNNKFINNSYYSLNGGDVQVFVYGRDGNYASSECITGIDIENNFFTRVQGTAISLGSVSDSKIQNNLFYNCPRKAATDKDCTIWLMNCADLMIQGNYNVYALGNDAYIPVIATGTTNQNLISLSENINLSY